VRLNLSFLLVPAVIMYAPGRPVSAMLGWLVGIALAITWHEIGHAVAFKAYGHEPQIGLVGFIGFTFSERARELSERQMLVVVAAGPGASLLLAGIALFVRDTVFAGAARHPLDVFVVINVVTGLFNLLPIYPLDGGRILRSLVSMASPTHGAKAAHAVSLGIALLALVYAVNHEMQITGLLLLGTAGMNLSALRATAQRPESAAPR
jgi:Zn-dependent protease